MTNNFQIIENGYNSSYITSLLTALFYKPENSKKILDVNPKNQKFIYIQEFIRQKFIANIQKGFCIYSEIINEFRNYVNGCGWQITLDDMLEEHDVADFYSYIMNGLYGSSTFIFFKINNNTTKNTINYMNICNNEYKFKNYNNHSDSDSDFYTDTDTDTDSNSDSDSDSAKNINHEFRTFIIDITINGSDENEKITHNLSKLFKSWINRNITMNNEYSYKMRKYFDILPIRIRRQNNCKTKLNIMKYIKLFDIDDCISQTTLVWEIQSIICYKKSTGYYSVVFDGEKWLFISDKLVPSVKECDMSLKTCVDDISENAVVVFYRLYK